MTTIKELFYRPPFVGLLAFVVVFITQGLGHTLMVLVEHFFGSTYQYQAAFILGLVGSVLLFVGMMRHFHNVNILLNRQTSY